MRLYDGLRHQGRCFLAVQMDRSSILVGLVLAPSARGQCKKGHGLRTFYVRYALQP